MKINLKPIKEHSYTWAEGFSLCAKMSTGEHGMRQIDWDTVREIINSNEFEKIEVGLAEDYEQTHAVIFNNDDVNIKENLGAGFYGCSRWATPSVKLTKNNETILFECWVKGDKSGFPRWLKDMSNKSQ